jgi:hypothetical protein
MNVACPTCGAWSNVIETRQPLRLMLCGNNHRFLTQETPMTKHLITPAELAERWRMDRRTLANWRTAGKGPAYLKVGVGKCARVLYSEADVESYERNNQRQPAQGDNAAEQGVAA